MPTCELDEVTIHYEERGDGPAFIYCHGLGGSGEGFERDDMDWFAARFRTVSWDNRGLGRSSAAAKYSLPRYAADLDGLLGHLGIERAIVMGVSWGGVLVQRFALDYPERCAAIVLDSTSSEVNVAASENWYARGELARLGPEAVAKREYVPAFAGHATVSSESAPGRTVADQHIDSYVAQSRATASLREHPLTPELHRITCPTLVVGGGADRVAGAGGSVIISRAIPRAQLEVVEDAGHAVYRQAPERFRTLLTDFVAAHGLDAG
jgi:pimeloyl-ACP methyl ester carboxylesterase